MIDLYAGLSEDYLQNINATLSTGDYAGGTAGGAGFLPVGVVATENTALTYRFPAHGLY